MLTKHSILDQEWIITDLDHTFEVIPALDPDPTSKEGHVKNDKNLLGLQQSF
jgi:hypothetical protein